MSLHALIRSGACRQVVLFDADTIDGSNLNRLDASFVDVGLPKAQVAGRKIALVNPYVEYTGFCGAYDNQSRTLVERALPEGLDIVVEAVDDMPAKAITRLDSRSWQALHLMPTDLGHTAMLDVQRPDDEATMVGLTAQELTKLAEGVASQEATHRMMLRFVGLRNVAPTMLKSFLDFQGGTLPGVPQLHSTASRAAAMVVHAVEAHVSGQGLASGRYRCNSRKLLNLHRDMTLAESLECYKQALQSRK